MKFSGFFMDKSEEIRHTAAHIIFDKKETSK